MTLPFFYIIPLWVVALIFFVLLSACLEVSYRIGLWKLRRGTGRELDSRGDTVLAAMLAMLGLVLAFTYSFTVTRSDLRKAAVLEETNALGNAFRRAELLAEPHRSEIRTQLFDYTRALQIEEQQFRSASQIRRALEQVREAQAGIWPATRAMATDNRPMAPEQSATVQAVLAVLDAHTARMQAVFDRLPTAIHLMLIFIAGASLSVAGFSAGRANSLRRWRMTALMLVITAMMFVILDFDRPGSGFVQTSREGYELLLEEMEQGWKERTP